ncbi:MAG: DUF58 domain-containing protein [Pirellula sp.]|jgi:uncharacterized protein (DUF58 family)|nr:DUF58 domain-containing protein [Pirellula sp.]
MSFYDVVGSYLFWAPWIGLIAITAPLVILGMGWRIFPTMRWLWILSSLALLSLLMIAVPAAAGALYPDSQTSIAGMLRYGAELFIYFLVLFDLLAISFLILDLLTLTGPSGIRVERRMLRSASLGGYHDSQLILENRSDRTHRLEVREDLPEGFQCEPESHHIQLGPRKRIELDQRLRPNRRGVFRFHVVYFQLFSRLGFWRRLIQRPCDSELLVYPNMQQLDEYALLARTNRLSLIGVRRTRKLGQDNNFERLRDYTQDDNYKHIDWRATARRNKLTVKQFQQDQSQRLVFLLDCGRMMTNEYRGLSLLDYALNSILMLSYVALHQGDSVGMMCFSDRVEKFVPLRGGSDQMNRILHGLFDRFPSMKQSNFDDAFLYFSKRCRRRTMVVLITSVIDDVTASQVTGYLSTLTSRHLPVLVLLRDHRIFDAADNPAMDQDALFRSAAAAQILTWRNDVLRKIQDMGVLTIDSFPDQLTAPLVNRYLEVKAKHLL